MPAAPTHADLANAVRALAMDAVEQARSGHPGMPMGMADVATVLFLRHLRFDPADPAWPDRDRLVLSAGHGSMLLYAALHLAGYADFPIDALRRFRQLGSPCAGHPEHGHGAGIETTTGPLGQGIATAVGMALAERRLAAELGPAIVDHRTFVIASDGDLMEGVSHEACSLAGHLGLAKLIVLWDDNAISIDGPTALAVSEDTLARFRAYGWEAERIDGHDPAAIDAALARAVAAERPTLVACRTVIARGAPTKAGTAASHGAPLGAAEVVGTRAALGWQHPPFHVPDAIYAVWREPGARGAARHAAWRARVAALPAGRRAELERRLAGRLPAGLDAAVAEAKERLARERPRWATRKASQAALETLTAVMPELIGGSADLTGSVLTRTAATPVLDPADFAGRHVAYGVREHAMMAAMNGIALHRGLVPYAGTFLVFTDYCRPAIRLAALMGQRVVLVATHDSIGLGEDGPTHQPIEHLAALRAIPGLLVFRPADPIETLECWAAALREAHRPSVLALSRQEVPTLRDDGDAADRSARGAYVLVEADGPRDVTLLATGTEVALAGEARALLARDGIHAAVVSIPCWALFDEQPADHIRAVLGTALRIAVEAATPFGWARYVASEDDVVGLRGFGASAPGPVLYEHFGITAEAVAAKVRGRLGRSG
jgi:transketolase